MTPAAIGLAVFGAGRIGAVHARNIAQHVPGASLVGVADIDRAAAQRIVGVIGVGRVDDVQAFLGDRAVQGIVIATPTDTHTELIMQAASARKHVFCEKPISLRLAATQEAIACAQREDILLQVGFQRRFDPEFMRARNLVEKGDIGSVRFLRLVARDHSMPSTSYLRTSGGQYRDQMIHELDVARWFMAPLEVDEVYATGSALIDPSLDRLGEVDTVLAVLRFRGGALGIIDNSREAIYGYDVRGEIHGSEGMLLIGHQRFTSGELIDSKYATPDVGSFIERFADAYRAEIADFTAAIQERRAPRVGAKDALEALRLAIAADRSLHTQRPVKLVEVTDDYDQHPQAAAHTR